MRKVTGVRLQEFARSVLVSVGVPHKDALVISESLVQANLEGIDSHGVSRLPVYVQRMLEGRINVRPELRIARRGCILKVDGDNGLGQVVSCRSIESAIPVAKKWGIAAVFIRHSNHNGAGAFFCQQAIKENIILMAMTNTPPGISPTGGKEARLGTNPIAFGFPVKKGPPIIVDFASSKVARGKIILAARQNRTIPSGWAVDVNGMNTTDAHSALKGSMIPVGGAKGYALATAIELFCGVLSGAAFGTQVGSINEDQGQSHANIGHHFILYYFPHFISEEEYYTRMECFLRMIKETPLSQNSNGIYYPGERRYQRYLKRKRKGICLSDQVWKDLNELAHKLSLPALSDAKL
ncbi:Ldh family oxidoreductase [Thermoactinomyces mirandus]|uniref:Ldh family oxidoreductase n=1 Tax=Thermoactinomyces mirandus TaxID=2756294 RepID=A0A7W1XV89_9BACL|nr:Ldh family oxidoreductase [Thermoactinomyces mirandus]MBA4603924.1 Ldh family oxidoreductase [Thermoactinomyces mirandus]